MPDVLFSGREPGEGISELAIEEYAAHSASWFSAEHEAAHHPLTATPPRLKKGATFSAKRRGSVAGAAMPKLGEPPAPLLKSKSTGGKLLSSETPPNQRKGGSSIHLHKEMVKETLRAHQRAPKSAEQLEVLRVALRGNFLFRGLDQARDLAGTSLDLRPISAGTASARCRRISTASCTRWSGSRCRRGGR